MTYGEKVFGYEHGVVNEREARAAAGILFLFGMISFLNSFLLGSFIMTQYFVGFFMVDFLVRIVNPRYSPSMLLGKFFVRNQIPEYVGASQKRFAWSIGFLLSTVMFYLVVINPQMNPIKILICVTCLALLISESAFSICLGCKIYNLFNKEKSTNCPGGVCEIREKEPIQTFNLAQKFIALAVVTGALYGLYNFSVNTPNKSVAMQMMPMMMMSSEERVRAQEAEYQRQVDAEFNDDEETTDDKSDCVVPQHAIDMGHEKMWRENNC